MSPFGKPFHFLRQHSAIALAILAGLFASALLLSPLLDRDRLPRGADFVLHVGNVVESARLLSMKAPPWDWLPDIAGGYGGPNYLYYGYQAFILPAALVNAGLSPVAALKVLAGLGFAVGAVSAFLWCSLMGGRLAGLVGAVLYLYGPYYFSLAYLRAGYPEFISCSFYPLLFYLAHRWITEKSIASLIFGSITLGAIVSIHTLSLIIVTPFLALYSLGIAAGSKRGHRRWPLLLILGLFLSAQSLYSPLFEKHKVALEKQFSDAALYKEIGVPWYSWFNHRSIDDIISHQIPGRVHVLGFLAAAVVLVAGLAKGKAPGPLKACLALACLALLAAERRIAALSVEVVPVLRYLQFPWRFLSMFNLFSSAAAACLVSGVTARKVRYLIAIAVPLVCAAIYLPGIKLQSSSGFPAVTLERIRRSLTTLDHENKYMPAGSRLPDQLAPKTLLEAPGCEIELSKEGLNDYTFDVHSPSPVEALFHQYHFDGWRAEIDGSESPLKQAGKLGICGFNLPEGRHEVRLFFTSTPSRSVSRGISLAALILLIGLAALGAARKVFPRPRES